MSNLFLIRLDRALSSVAKTVEIATIPARKYASGLADLDYLLMCM